MKPFRFGVMPRLSKESLPVKQWTHAVQKIEKLGYSTVFRDDHITTMSPDPITMLASAASVTTTLNIGSLVFAVDFRHPTILAKAGAALHQLSSGRFEFGIGAGYRQNDYSMSGIRLDPPGMRVERLEEALKIITGMWTQERTSFSGKHYQVNEIEKAGFLPDGEHPKIMIGGGGRKILRLAAQYADIVGVIPRWRGSFGKSIVEKQFEVMKKKIIRVKQIAKDFGRDPKDLEFQLISLFTEITDNPRPVIENYTDSLGITVDEAENSMLVMIGSGSDIRDKIQGLREETGVNYYAFRLRRDQIEDYAESIVQPLTS